MLSEEGDTPESQLAPSLSEVKGMVNRCMRKDQPDWLSVYEALGRPDRGWMRRTVGALDRLRRAPRDADEAAVMKARSELRGLGAVERLRSAREAVLRSAPNLLDVSTSSRRGRENPADSRKEPDVTAGRSASGATRKKLGRANADHREVLTTLASYLASHGHEIEEGRHVDAFCHLRTGPAIFKVLSV